DHPNGPRDAIVTENTAAAEWCSAGLHQRTPAAGRSIRYHVDCYGCGPVSSSSPRIRFEPGQSLSRPASVAIRACSPLTRSHIHVYVYALNGVSRGGCGREARCWGRHRQDHCVTQRQDRQPDLGAAQLDKSDPNIEEFELKNFRQKKDHSRPLFHFTRRSSFLVKELEQELPYILVQRPSAAGGSTTTKPTPSSGQSGASISIIIGAVVAVLLCLIIVLSMIILMSRARVSVQLETVSSRGWPWPTSSPSSSSSSRSYVDPHTTYEDPCQAVQRVRAKEIDASWICHRHRVLGGARVRATLCKGLLTVPGPANVQLVAVKNSEAGRIRDKNKLDFLDRRRPSWANSTHPNVIFLEGRRTHKEATRPLIVTRVHGQRSLDTFLRPRRAAQQRSSWWDAARHRQRQCAILSDTGYIPPRDLAARKTSCSVCKVSDFGLSREIPVDPATAAAAANEAKDGTYTPPGAAARSPSGGRRRRPFHFRKFTSATDV
uniref:Protein kinase domain-containing protein n=1 Tax=Macrostomum lignano TaxID=282301 RepID=A0A1I8F9K4_9PLAT